MRFRAPGTWLVLAVLGSSLLASGKTWAQDAWKPDARVGDFQFNIPDGWKRVESQGGAMLVPKNLPKGGAAFIDFIPTQELQGDLRSWFNAHWAEWRKQFKVQQTGEIEAEHNPHGFDVLRIDARVNSRALGYSEFVFVAVQARNRVAGYYWVNNTGYYSYRDSLSDFEHSLFFGKGPSPAGEPAAAKSGVAAGMQGVYIGYKMRGMAGLRTHFEYLTFLPDGNVVRLLPEQGLDNFDFKDAVRKDRDYCGRYRVNGNTIKITWGDNNTEVATREGTSLKIQGDSYFPVPRSDGLKLNGAYHQEGTAAAPYTIRFRSDGSFTENGMLNLVNYRDQKQNGGRGTYRIGNNTITLTYADGRKVPLSFYILSQDASGAVPNRIHINTYPLVLMP
ncbi:MAG TPA: hypothetical protein VI488_17590 [Candidatus Angelobacter sp.]